MALWIAAAESAAAVVLVLDVDHNFESGRLGSNITSMSIRDDEVGLLGFFPTDICWLAVIPAVFVIRDRAKHNHSVAEAELRMRYRAVRAFINGVPRETKHFAKPVDGGFGV